MPLTPFTQCIHTQDTGKKVVLLKHMWKSMNNDMRAGRMQYACGTYVIRMWHACGRMLGQMLVVHAWHMRATHVARMSAFSWGRRCWWWEWLRNSSNLHDLGMVGVGHPGVVGVLAIPPATVTPLVLVEAVVAGVGVRSLAMPVERGAEPALHMRATPAMAPAPEPVLVHGGR